MSISKFLFVFFITFDFLFIDWSQWWGAQPVPLIPPPHVLLPCPPLGLPSCFLVCPIGVSDEVPSSPPLSLPLMSYSHVHGLPCCFWYVRLFISQPKSVMRGPMMTKISEANKIYEAMEGEGSTVSLIHGIAVYVFVFKRMIPFCSNSPQNVRKEWRMIEEKMQRIM